MDTKIECEEISLKYAPLAAIASFASSDDSRPVLCSVCLEFQGLFARLVATDGRRLGVLKIDIGHRVEPSRVILPMRFIKNAKVFSKAELLQLTIERIEEDEGELFAGTRLTFHDGRDSVVGWAIEDNYPNWQVVLPTGEPEPSESLSFNLSLVTDCANAVKTLSGDKGESVYLRRYPGSDDDDEDAGVYSLHIPTNPNFFGIITTLRGVKQHGLPDWVGYQAAGKGKKK